MNNNNANIKKLLSFLLLQPRTDRVNSFIGYIQLLKAVDEDITWDHIIDYIISFDNTALDIFEKDPNEDILKQYCIIFNNCYNFINEEQSISFVKEAPFNNDRVATIKSYDKYLAARRLLINEYAKHKGIG